MKTEAINQEEFNPYAAPTAQVLDAVGPGTEPVFFPVSRLKLALMSIVTFGIYEVYWFYKNWKCVQRNYGDDVNAPIRALFYPIVSYPLFKRIRDHAKTARVEANVQAGLLAIVVFVFATLWRLPDPWWLVSFLGFVPLVLVQNAVNAINRKLAPGAGTNSRFSGWNIFGLIAGGIFLILAVVGTLIGE